MEMIVEYEIISLYYCIGSSLINMLSVLVHEMFVETRFKNIMDKSRGLIMKKMFKCNNVKQAKYLPVFQSRNNLVLDNVKIQVPVTFKCEAQVNGSMSCS